MIARSPEVSICVPMYQAARWITEALHSAFAQTHEDLEVVVVDDASSDGSADIVDRLADPRLRLVRNANRRGEIGNHNRCLELARGRLIKFLDQDDTLAPNCVERMAGVFRKYPSVGLVFSRRSIVWNGVPDEAARAWTEEFGAVQEHFSRIAEINSGRELFDDWVRRGFGRNWIGEPSNVMVRRSCFERLGGFSSRVAMDMDTDMWFRTLFYYDAGFVDEALAIRRLHSYSSTAESERSGRGWLDRVWMADGMLTYPEVRTAMPAVEAIRRERLQTAIRIAASGLIHCRPRSAMQARELIGYAAYRVARHLGRARQFFPEIPPAGEDH
jgi:glycosyltransferase involved in cell wall biosynthesis